MDIILLSRSQRRQAKKDSFWRILGFYKYSAACQRIFDNKDLKDMCSMILGKTALPEFTINFLYGSRQHLHQDGAVFHIHPMNYLVGTWLACEDISLDSGPLVYYPRSHKEPSYSGFNNYPQTNAHTCDMLTYIDYGDYINKAAEKYERKSFAAKKGDILLWHPMLIHGGDDVVNEELSRKSYVCHYIGENNNKADEISGPFNW